MGEVSAIGPDIAKSVFQVHGVEVRAYEGASVPPLWWAKLLNGANHHECSSHSWQISARRP
jgi:hypothetical protein